MDLLKTSYRKQQQKGDEEMSGLTIRNNGMGMVVWNLNRNQSRVRKALEHLSSGYRINRSGDDAAGLAISEKMRGQIRGLDQAADNCKEGIHLITVGEGILTEVHSMLQRANVLAEQSANGVCLDERDRESLQEELDQICAEIDRVTQNANYNEIRLFQDFGYQYETSSEMAADPAHQAVLPGKQGTVKMQNLPSGTQMAAHVQNASFAAQAAAYSENTGANSVLYAASLAAALENGVGSELDIVVSDSGSV